MHKAIVSGLLATSMLVSTAAQAINVSGAPQYTITEIQAKIDSGEFYNYPGVIREGHNGIRIGPAGNNYLFGKTFEVGQALPEITDIVALQRAVKAEKKTVLVASNEWILPVPAVFVELGRQNGVDGATFMEHYVISTTSIDSEGFAEYAEAQTKAVVEALGISSVTINTAPLIDAGILDELQAVQIENAALQVALNEANAMIDSLTAENLDLLAQITTLSSTITGLEAVNSELETTNSGLMTQVGELRSELRTAEANFQQLVTASNSINGALTAQVTSLSGQVTALQTTLDNIGTSIASVQDLTDEAIVASKSGPAAIASLRGQESPNNYNQPGIGDVDASHTSSLAGNLYAQSSGRFLPGGAINPNPTITVAAALNVVTNHIADAVAEAYNDGYADGYRDGYADGFADGVASTQ